MKKTLRSLSRVVIINFIFFFIVIYFLNKQSVPAKVIVNNSNITSNTISPILVSLPASLPPQITTPTSPPSLMSQLASHNSRSSCWFVIDGSLYDITPFFGSHPGGDEIMLKYCGTDASNGYNTKDKMIPADHSASAKAMLQQYLIQ